MLKLCDVCGTEFDAFGSAKRCSASCSAFGKRRREKDGRRLNPEGGVKRMREWRKNNKERHLARDRAYAARRYAENPEPVKSLARKTWHKRRTQKLGAGGSDWGVGYMNTFVRCHTCGIRFLAPEDREVGHMVPLSRGGSNLKVNVKGQCVSCNRGPGGQHAKIYLREWLPASRAGLVRN